MLEQHFPVPTVPSADILGPLEGGERVMWRGRAGVAEYAFDRQASLPRWTLPETAHVLVTDRRVIYAHASDDGDQAITSGELRWLWPQYLRLQPGARTSDRGAAATQIQLVCGASDGSYPALVFAGGDLKTVGDADKVANVLRQAIARFRVDNAKRLGLSMPQERMLSRLLIGPEFSNYQGGQGQTVSVLGALLVSRAAPVTTESTPAPEAAAPAVPEPALPASVAEGTRVIHTRPGIQADASRAWAAARAEQVTQQAKPDLASRAANLAARVADLVSGRTPGQPAAEQPLSERPTEERLTLERLTPEHLTPEGPVAERPSRDRRSARHQSPDPAEEWELDQEPPDQRSWPPEPDPASFEVPTTNLAERAAVLRRSTARFTANSAGSRVAGRREPGITSGGRKN